MIQGKFDVKFHGGCEAVTFYTGRKIGSKVVATRGAGRKFEISTTGRSNRRVRTQKMRNIMAMCMWMEMTWNLEHIDKSVVLVGGFNEKTVEEAEALVQQMMVGIAGYTSVEIIDGESPLGLATFDSPVQAMKFIRSQKKNGTIHTNKLWASEFHGQNVFDAK